MWWEYKERGLGLEHIVLYVLSLSFSEAPRVRVLFSVRTLNMVVASTAQLVKSIISISKTSPTVDLGARLYSSSKKHFNIEAK